MEVGLLQNRLHFWKKYKILINKKNTFPSLSRTFLVSKNLLATTTRPFLTRIWSCLSSFVGRTFVFYQIATLSALLIKYVSLSCSKNHIRVSQMHTLTRSKICRIWQYMFKKCLSNILNKGF